MTKNVYLNNHKRKVNNIQVDSWNMNWDGWLLEQEGQSPMPIYKLEKRGSDKCFAQSHLTNGDYSGATVYIFYFLAFSVN